MKDDKMLWKEKLYTLYLGTGHWWKGLLVFGQIKKDMQVTLNALYVVVIPLQRGLNIGCS